MRKHIVLLGVIMCAAAQLWADRVTTPTELMKPRLRNTVATTRTLDQSYRIGSVQWKKSSAHEWLSPQIKAAFPFDELIYDWNVRIPRDEGFRLYLRVGFADKTHSPWLYAGYWGTVAYCEQREIPKFDRGKLDYDQLLLTTTALTFQYKLVDEGKRPLSVRPSLRVIVTANNPPDALFTQFAKPPVRSTVPEMIHDVPLRLQRDVAGNKLTDRCQSAALASALQYFGTTLPLEQIIYWTTDPEYVSFGIWPRTINAAVEYGFNAYIDRFRDWDKVRETVAQNKIILCSITMPEKDEYLAPPYRRMGGHIVALCGVTDDNRVIVTDSALDEKSRGYLVQWLMPDFEKIWMRNKGGVGMVICPPKGFKPRFVEKLPPFPRSIGTVGWPDDAQTTTTQPPQ